MTSEQSVSSKGSPALGSLISPMNCLAAALTISATLAVESCVRSDTFLRDWRPRWIACTFAAASKSDNAGREFSRFGFTSDGVAGVASATSPPDEFMRGGACAGICGPPRRRAPVTCAA